MLPVLDIRNNRLVQETPSPFSHLAESISRNCSEQMLSLEGGEGGRAKDAKLYSAESCGRFYGLQADPPSNITAERGRLVQAFVKFVTGTNIIRRRRYAPSRGSAIPKFDSVKEDSKRVLLFSLCSLYWYGGYAFGKHVRDVPAFIIDAIPTSESVCTDHDVMLVSQVGGADHVPEIMFASSPRHPSVRCLIDKITTAESDAFSFFFCYP
jgi:hypothetical protein